MRHRELECSISEKFKAFIMFTDGLIRFIEKRTMNARCLIQRNILRRDAKVCKNCQEIFIIVCHW